jgi:hypothetical protein
MTEENVYPICIEKKWLFVDKSGNPYHLDVEPLLVQDAGEETCFIETATGMGLVDSKLNWLIRPDLVMQEKRPHYTNKINEGFLSRYNTFFTEGLSTAQDFEGKYGFIDKSGNWKIKAEYNSAVRFCEGLASVMKDGLWGAIDTNGQVIIDFQYASQFFFRNGTATVYKKDSNLYGGLIDKTGKMLVEPQFYDNKGHSEGLMPAGKTKKYGYYDLSGRAVFPEIFDQASLFDNGKAVVSFKGKYGVIDKDRNFVIQAVYDYLGNFANGLASARVGTKYGFIDGSGKLIIAPVFDYASDFGTNGLSKVIVNKLFKNANEFISITNNYYHYINLEGKFVHPEKPDFEIISVDQWEKENPEAFAALSVKVIDDLNEYLFLNETLLEKETENAVNEREIKEKTTETELRPLKFNDLIKVPYFMVNFISAILFGFNCSIYSPLEYPQVWHRFIFLGIFAIFGYFSGKTFAEYQYIEGNNFSWKNREGYFGGLLLLIMGLGYFFNITNYLKALFTLLDFVFLLAFFITTGMTLGNIFRRMAAELMPSNQKGLQLVVGLLFIISLLNAIAFSSDIYTPHGVLGISALIAVPAGIIWIFLSNRKPEYEGATSLWNAFYFGSNSASFTTRSFYKKQYTERQFKEWDEKNTTYTFDGDERSIAASRGGVGVVCIFFTNLVIISSPWFLAVLIKKFFYFF